MGYASFLKINFLVNLNFEHMKYIFGNWKMYLDYKQSVDLANSLVKENLKNENVEIAVFPTALAMKDVTDILQENFKTGAQDAGHSAYSGYFW